MRRKKEYRTAERVTDTNRMQQASLSNHVRVVIQISLTVENDTIDAGSNTADKTVAIGDN